MIMRRQLTPEWLILELRGGVGWPRRRLTEKREASPEIGIAIEMQFGQKRDRLRSTAPASRWQSNSLQAIASRKFRRASEE